MVSVVGICNLALGHLGDRATVSSIDPPEGSAQADHCAMFWPVARDEALETHDWRWASGVTTTAQLDASVMTDPRWLYAYAMPSDCIVIRDMVRTDGVAFLYQPGAPDYEQGTLENGTPVLFSNTDLAAVRYTRRISDPTRYPPKFVTGVSFLLASFLAGPVVKGKSGVGLGDAMRKRWEYFAGQAAVTDANASSSKPSFMPSALRARGFGNLYGTTIEDGQLRYELPYWAQG